MRSSRTIVAMLILAVVAAAAVIAVPVAWAELYQVEGGTLDINWEVKGGCLIIKGRVQDYMGCDKGDIRMRFTTRKEGPVYPVRIPMQKIAYSEFIEYIEAINIYWSEIVGLDRVWIQCR